VLEAPDGRGGQVEDGREAGLQPPPPGPDQVSVFVSHNKGPQPTMSRSTPANEELAARTAGHGQAVQELDGAIGCSGQPKVAVKQQGGADRGERVEAGVGVQPAAQPERPGEAKGQERPVQPDRSHAAGLQEPGVASRPAPDVQYRPLDQVEQHLLEGVTGAK
jgi:hypothetical protein